jgi:hypothetical protein
MAAGFQWRVFAASTVMRGVSHLKEAAASMSAQFPRRSESHQLEEASERYLRTALPRGWTCEKPQHDYGVDLRIDIFEDGAATGLELLVQLKASAKSTEGETEVVRMKTVTYNHLWSKLQVVMLIKYVEPINEAYWLLLRDVQVPAADQETFTVHIPKAHRLSAINWHAIQGYVRNVTDTKLAAMRRQALARGA